MLEILCHAGIMPKALFLVRRLSPLVSFAMPAKTVRRSPLSPLHTAPATTIQRILNLAAPIRAAATSCRATTGPTSSISTSRIDRLEIGR